MNSMALIAAENNRWCHHRRIGSFDTLALKTWLAAYLLSINLDHNILATGLAGIDAVRTAAIDIVTFFQPA